MSVVVYDGAYIPLGTTPDGFGVELSTPAVCTNGKWCFSLTMMVAHNRMEMIDLGALEDYL